MTDYAISRTKTRARRRKMPRPPKFTRRQKAWLAIEIAGLVASLVWFIVEPSACMLLNIAGWTASAQATVLEALRRPLDAVRSNACGLALFGAALLAGVIA